MTSVMSVPSLGPPALILVGVATVVVVSSAPLVPSPGTSTLALVGVVRVVVVLVDVAAWLAALVVLVCRVVVVVGRVVEVVVAREVELDDVLVSSVGTDA